MNTDLAGLPSGEDVMVWLGHSSWYLQLAGKRILIDRYLAITPRRSLSSIRLSPVITRGTLQRCRIDLLIISHDHYDHLDYATIKALMPKVKRVVTPLGVGSHLRYWGMDAAIIDEVDWNQTIKISDELTVHALPARHFSGRGLKRNQTLWASFLFVTPQERFITAAIAAMARILRPLANSLALSIWQSWKTVNMTGLEVHPHDAGRNGRAADDYAPGRYYRGMPDALCWLAKHSWDDPYQRLAAASEGREWRLVTPMLGEPVWVADKTQSFNAWWR